MLTLPEEGINPILHTTYYSIGYKCTYCRSGLRLWEENKLFCSRQRKSRTFIYCSISHCLSTSCNVHWHIRLHIYCNLYIIRKNVLPLKQELLYCFRDDGSSFSERVQRECKQHLHGSSDCNKQRTGIHKRQFYGSKLSFKNMRHYLNILATLVQTSLSFTRFSSIRQSSVTAPLSRSLHLDWGKSTKFRKVAVSCRKEI